MTSHGLCSRDSNMLRGGATVNGLFPDDFSFLQLLTSEGFLEHIWYTILQQPDFLKDHMFWPQ